MWRFECPDCDKFLGLSDGTSLETKCQRCGKVVQAKRVESQVTLECERCGRRHRYETPDQKPTYCVQCGTHSLREVPALNKPIEVPYLRVVNGS
jgi:phage FluMu protein Com